MIMHITFAKKEIITMAKTLTNLDSLFIAYIVMLFLASLAFLVNKNIVPMLLSTTLNFGILINMVFLK